MKLEVALKKQRKEELQVRISKEFVSDIDNVFQYGIETFGPRHGILGTGTLTHDLLVRRLWARPTSKFKSGVFSLPILFLFCQSYFFFVTLAGIGLHQKAKPY